MNFFFFYSTSFSIDSFSLSTETIGSLVDVEAACLIKHNFKRGINRTLPSQFLIKKNEEYNSNFWLNKKQFLPEFFHSIDLHQIGYF